MVLESRYEYEKDDFLLDPFRIFRLAPFVLGFGVSSGIVGGAGR